MIFHGFKGSRDSAPEANGLKIPSLYQYLLLLVLVIRAMRQFVSSSNLKI